MSELPKTVSFVIKTGIELVLGATVGPGLGMTTGAGLDAVAADLHVPEQGFAQGDGGRLILNEIREIGWLRYGHIFEGGPPGPEPFPGPLIR